MRKWGYDMKEYEFHPALLKQSRGHYDQPNKIPNLIEFECENNIGSALGACSYNIIKYKNRDKGSDHLDEIKKQTFEAWRELLRDLLERGYTYDTNLRHAMISEYPDMKYTFNGEDDE